MKTPHSCHDFGPTLDTELNVNKYVRMLNDIDTQQDSQSWASLTSQKLDQIKYATLYSNEDITVMRHTVIKLWIHTTKWLSYTLLYKMASKTSKISRL